MRTVGSNVFSTYQEAAIERGLLSDDKNHHEALLEANLVETDIGNIRNLFAMILALGNPSDPGKLWESHKHKMGYDILRSQRIKLGVPDLKYNQETQDITLYHMNQLLTSYNKKIENFHGIPQISPGFQIDQTNDQYPNKPLIKSHFAYDKEALAVFHRECLLKLNKGQLAAYNEIMQKKSSNNSLFFIDGPGGTGKTFLYNTILAKFRSEGKVALAVATSGIAAVLLDGGQTAHSLFKIPIQINAESNCRVEINSELAELIRLAEVIIWDESVMAHKHIFKAVEHLVTDCMSLNKAVNQTEYPTSNQKIEFGGKLVIFGGDFRQVLPVIARGNRSQIVNSTFKKNSFWKNTKMVKLTENMRIKSAASNDGVELSKLEEFSDFLLSVGEGKIKPFDKQVPDVIKLKGGIGKNMDQKELIELIYPNIEKNYKDRDFMCERAILTSKNKDVNVINLLARDYFPGEKMEYLSADSVLDPEHRNRFPVEFLNKIEPPGLPPHKLSLKLHQPIILLRNIAQSQGLCNGTRLIIKAFHKHLLDVEIAIGKNKGKRFLIPKLAITPSDLDFPFSIQRVQFPIRSAFAMTINKSQGATLKKVGVFLNDPCFSHGQLYVALSRVSSLKDIIVATDSTVEGCTRNVVYHEVFH